MRNFALGLLAGVVLVLGTWTLIRIWWQWRPRQPPAQFLNVHTRERRQMLYHDEDPLH